MTRVGIITQARTTSTRLPGKVLITVAGKTLLEHHLDRLEASGLPVLVATTVNDTDDRIVELATSRAIPAYRGSEEDVLARFHECASVNELEAVVRVTSDCPLIDGQIIAAAVAEFEKADDPWLYLSNTLERSFPRGFDFEVFSFEALTEAATQAVHPVQREHVTPYLYSNEAGHMHLRNIAWPEDRSDYRVTLDTPEDLDVIRSLIEDHAALTLDCAGIIDVLERNPDLAALNRHVEQKKLGE